jgi:hypothetical protein
MITCTIVMSSVGFLISESDIIEMLINIPALLFINQIKDYVGISFKKHLKMHHPEITDNKLDFMRVDRQDHIYFRAWFRWNQLTLFLNGFTAIINYYIKNWKCENFEVWYEREFVLNDSNALPKGLKILDGIKKINTAL